MAEINWPDFQFPPVNLWVISAQSTALKTEFDDADEALKLKRDDESQEQR